MKIETLVVTVDQTDDSLVKRMNIQTDAVIGNQCGRNADEIYENNGCRILYLNRAERGVGRNRNLVIENSTGDICVFADDDMRFVDGYVKVMERAVALAPDADVWIFNVIKKRASGHVNSKVKRVGYGNYERYGASRFVIRRESIVNANIRFDLRFGGGTTYSSGEDTLFLKACLDKKLKIMAVPLSLAEIDQDSVSTWFKGYNEKFFYDKGVIYQVLHPYLAPAYIIRFALKYRKKYKAEFTTHAALKTMFRGMRQFAMESAK